ncbi:hypothetical protein ACVW01_001550 [Thermostichus sp. MS-CIW-19]|jgi:hypothetical protein|uniref:hypothetical protein n=2 Tax=Synechococcus TaxID=1129 RepID=UPI000C182A7C|nr:MULTISPECIES: hypothetical protein [unclassified Synechococcus]PIK87616.1 hypothetical protein SYN65AY6A5_00080 [Synechococcus sp. 65AY6A5]PIK95759.1 hypothetical protein SYN60AY4M2_10385 [Synechococcus sp. 60AY4M2]PIK97999.1 hypothetical protein SYN63AY4M1_07785 [Synechococcus sp. 63AY4M1]PIL01277.1 hypothetical protein SYN65AY640_06285 [Synechococcus sp. 65AY640]
MLNLSLLKEDESYTFRSYFEMPYEPEEILAQFSYRLEIGEWTWPVAPAPPQTPALKNRIRQLLPLVSLTSETARRELLVAPVLTEVALHCRVPLRLEYPLMVNNWLKGSLDYLLRGKNILLVVEAKKDDLTRAFVQMAVEMIALAQVEPQAQIYGAVTIGSIWQFGQILGDPRTIRQDLTLYRVPEDLESVAGILTAMVGDPSQP